LPSSNGAAGGACARRLRDRSGCGLEAAVRVEDAVPDRLRVTIVLGRSQQRIAAAFSIDGELPRGERHVLPPSRRSQTEKPINLRPLSGPASASKITSASASFPGGLPFSFGMIFTDTSSPVC